MVHFCQENVEKFSRKFRIECYSTLLNSRLFGWKTYEHVFSSTMVHLEFTDMFSVFIELSKSFKLLES